MAKQQALQKFIFKIHSTRLRKTRWNLNLSIREAMKNNEIIPIADSMLLRFIDEIGGVDGLEIKAVEIIEEIKKIKKLKDAYRFKDQIRKLYEELHTIQFKPDYLCLIIDQESDYLAAYKKGFKVNGIEYKRLLATSGGVKGKTIVFVSERMHSALRKRIENNRQPDMPMVPAKYGAYEALTCSSSTPVSDPKGILVVPDCEVEFYEDVIMLDDSEHDEPVMTFKKHALIHKNASDGFGLMLPSRAEKWGKELGLNYIPSGLNTRYSFEKGMLVTMDFTQFAEKIAHSYLVKDVWGSMVDVRTVDVVLTASMLKLWDSYSSCKDYIDSCKSNHYQFSITKLCPDELEHERNLNYQFIQSYRLDDEEIDALIQPTIDEIHQILGGDYKKSILFLKGMAMNDSNILNFEPDYVKALLIDKRMVNDPYVRASIHRMMKKRIKDAKVGVIKVNGNFQTACGDPYALMQSMFGLKVTGLLKAGNFYSRYWNDKGVPEAVCFRAPMTCHNNIRTVSFSDTEEQKYWFRYIKTMLIFNCWDTTAEAENGEDFDGDQNLITDNPVLLKNTRKLPAIMCLQRKAPKKIITEDDLVKSNIDSFGDDIGVYTNGITSQFEIQAQFPKNSKEYAELDYRIMCGQLFQQNAIDKTKGIIAKPRPKSWFDYSANKIGDGDTKETKEKKEFYQKLVADKKPYFMQYIYPQTRKVYKKYVADVNKKCQTEFKLTLEELIDKQDRTAGEIKFLEYYQKHMPVGNHDCISNKICRCFEEEFDGYLAKYKEQCDFDYHILKSDVPYSTVQFKQIEAIYKDYCDRVAKYKHRMKSERMDEESVHLEKAAMAEAFRYQCSVQCPNSRQLTNIVLDLCYKSNKSKQFAWDICGETIVENLLYKNNYIVSYFEKDKHGDIEFRGERFVMKQKQIGGIDDDHHIK